MTGVAAWLRHSRQTTRGSGQSPHRSGRTASQASRRRNGRPRSGSAYRRKAVPLPCSSPKAFASWRGAGAPRPDPARNLGSL